MSETALDDEAAAAQAARTPEDDPWRRLVDALEAGGSGPVLIEGTAEDAREAGEAIAARLGVPHLVLPADTLGLIGDPVQDTLAVLRDAVYLRVRVLKKVYEGRVTAIRRLGDAPGALARRTPPAQIEVALRTDDDARTIRLEGAFARAFWQSGAAVSDIVQIDLDQPLVVVRRDREETEGYVAEERDLVYHVRLGDVDRSGVPAAPAEEGRTPAPMAPLRRPVLATGRLPAPEVAAMRATDLWAERLVGGKGTRLEPGVLVLTGAEALQRPALVVLREAATAPAAPLVLLGSEDPEAIAAWSRFFPHALRLS